MSLSPRLRAMLANCYDFVFALVCLVMGILYLVNAKLATSVIVWVIVGSCVVAGVINVLRYVRRTPVLNDHDRSLAKGIGYILLGVGCAVWPERLLGVSALLTGILLFAGALSYVQTAVDSYRTGVACWWLHLVAALPSIGFGLCFCLGVDNPVVLGIGLIVIAVTTFGLQAFLWVLSRQMNTAPRFAPKSAQPAAQPAAQPVDQPVDQPVAQPAAQSAGEAPVPPAEDATL